MNSGRPTRQKGKGMTDLWAGLAATAFFLVTASLLGIGWLTLCALLSAGVYFGVRLLLPTPVAPSEPETVEIIPTLEIFPPERILEMLREMSRHLPPALATQIAQIGSQSETLLSYFRAHPERADPGLDLAIDYLLMAYNLTHRWLDTFRATPQMAPQSAQKLEEFLTDVSHRLSQLYQGLTQADDAHLAGEIEALTRTMKEMDQFYQSIGGDPL